MSESVSVANYAVCNQSSTVRFFVVDVDPSFSASGEHAHPPMLPATHPTVVTKTVLALPTVGAEMATQLASMSREHILKHKRWIPDIEDHIRVRIPMLRLCLR